MFFRDSGVPGQPGRRLGDRVTLSDSDVMSSDTDVFLTSIVWRLSKDGGFQQDLTGIAAGSLYPYSDYYVIGTSKLGSSGGDIGRLFY